MIVGIDGDWLVYQTALSKEIKTSKNLGYALSTAKRTLEAELRICKADSYYMCLGESSGINYRHNIAITPGPNGTGYKAGRHERPLFYTEIRQYLMDYWEAKIIVDHEVDDELSIWQNNNTINQIDSTVIHVDKDLDQIVGNHRNPRNDWTYEVSDPGELRLEDNRKKIRGGGLLWFYAQMLMGDRVDNIPGLPGVGVVKAYELLNSCKDEEEMFKVVTEEYIIRIRDGAIKRMLEVCDLVWLQRSKDEPRKSVQLLEWSKQL